MFKFSFPLMLIFSTVTNAEVRVPTLKDYKKVCELHVSDSDSSKQVHREVISLKSKSYDDGYGQGYFGGSCLSRMINFKNLRICTDNKDHHQYRYNNVLLPDKVTFRLGYTIEISDEKDNYRYDYEELKLEVNDDELFDEVESVDYGVTLTLECI